MYRSRRSLCRQTQETSNPTVGEKRGKPRDRATSSLPVHTLTVPFVSLPDSLPRHGPATQKIKETELWGNQDEKEKHKKESLPSLTALSLIPVVIS